MTLNVHQNLLFKINSIDDNSLNKKSTRLIKPILVEDSYINIKKVDNDKKIKNEKIGENSNKFLYPFNFNKNNLFNFNNNNNDDISFKFTFDTLSNLNMSYPSHLNTINLYNIPSIPYINQSKEKDDIEKENINLKLKKKRKCNKFKVSRIEPKNKVNYRLKHKRKYKPDDIRKKIKARFHKSIKNILNENLRKAGSKHFFSFLPQIFISSISREKNSQVLDITYRELLEKDFVSDIDEKTYKNKKVDLSKYNNNKKVLEYLDNNPQIYKGSGFDIIGNMKYRELLEQYFNSEEFDKALAKLKEENEDDEYIEEYKNKAQTYVQFFSGDKEKKMHKGYEK